MCGWNCTFLYTVLKEERARWIDFSTQKRQAGQSDLRVPSVFLWKSKDSCLLATDWGCKALEHVRRALWLLCGWNCLLLYIILNEEGARRVDFGAKRGAASQSYLRVTSVSPMEK